jgi:hypothetical protein
MARLCAHCSVILLLHLAGPSHSREECHRSERCRYCDSKAHDTEDCNLANDPPAARDSPSRFERRPEQEDNRRSSHEERYSKPETELSSSGHRQQDSSQTTESERRHRTDAEESSRVCQDNTRRYAKPAEVDGDDICPYCMVSSKDPRSAHLGFFLEFHHHRDACKRAPYCSSCRSRSKCSP